MLPDDLRKLAAQVLNIDEEDVEFVHQARVVASEAEGAWRIGLDDPADLADNDFSRYLLLGYSEKLPAILADSQIEQGTTQVLDALVDGDEGIVFIAKAPKLHEVIAAVNELTYVPPALKEQAKDDAKKDNEAGKPASFFAQAADGIGKAAKVLAWGLVAVAAVGIGLTVWSKK